MNRLTRNPLLFGTTVLLLSAATMYGCSDFLEKAAAPEGTLNEETLSNGTGVEGSLIATYRAIEHNNGVGGAWGNAVSNWVWGSVVSDDAYKGSEKDDQPAINDIEAYFWGTADAEGYLNDKWRGMYEGVVRANSTLRLLKEVVAKSPSEISAARQASIEGEAKFLRAHFHFEAYRMWGSIPYYREDDTDFRKANEDTAAVLTDILADLDAAIGKLPTTQGEKGRATKWTAEAYKARVLTYKASVTHAPADWSAALTQLRKFAPGASPYALESSFDKVWTGFSTAENGPETIFVYQSSVDTDPNGDNSNWGERLNFPHSGSPFGCCGFHQPSQNLVNFYQVDAAGLPLAYSQGAAGATQASVTLNEGTAAWNASNTVFTGSATNLTPVDPRLDWTVGRDDVPFKDWGMHAVGWIRAPAYGGRYSPKKNVHEHTSGSEASKGWVPTQLNGVNIHIFRYADLLLMLAEAEIEAAGGSLANATAYINLVRARAGVRVQGCGTPTDPTLKAAADALVAKYPACAGDSRMAVPMNDASVKWAVYNVQPYPGTLTQTQARLAVQIERRLELAMEGQRFFDMRRWGNFKTELDGYLVREKNRQAYLAAAGVGIDAAKHRFFPIPPVQIELSKVNGTAMLKQWSTW